MKLKLSELQINNIKANKILTKKLTKRWKKVDRIFKS